MLTVLALEVRVGVGEDVDAVVAGDDPDLAARVARQARVSGRVDIASADALAHREARPNGRIVARGDAAIHHTRGRGQCEGRRGSRRAGRRRAGGRLLLRHQPVLHHLRFEPHEPAFVVAHAQVVDRRQPLDRVPADVDVPFAPRGQGPGERPDAPLPRFMEDRLVPFVVHSAQAVLTAHVVDAVHGRPPDAGSATRVTPTIVSRVTSAASASSLSPSLPAGRSGSTM